MKQYFKNLRTDKSIRKRYKELAKVLHPDTNPGIGAEEFVELNKQYKEALESALLRGFDKEKQSSHKEEGINKDERIENDDTLSIPEKDMNVQINVKTNFGDFSLGWKGSLPWMKKNR